MTEQPVAAQPALAPVHVVMERPAEVRRGGWGRWLGRLFWLAVTAAVVLIGLSMLGAWGAFGIDAEDRVTEKYHSRARVAPNKIAIITVDGAILDGDGFVKKQIDHVRRDNAVKAIVLRIDSPGGSVTASDYLYHHLCKLRDERQLPVVVSMGGLAASGGYYLAMSVGGTPGTIYAEPTTWTGSIGVIIPHYNVAGLMQRFEVQEDSIKSHPLKQMGSPTRIMTEQERQIFQGLVDDSFNRFKQIVVSGRAVFQSAAGAKRLDELATGQVFTTQQAIANGLVDAEGFVENAIDKAVSLAGLTADQVTAVKYKRPASIIDLFSGPGAKSAMPDLVTSIDLWSPRAYYLCTWLPAALASGRR